MGVGPIWSKPGRATPRDRYGAKRASDWLWEVWNEPDGLYWKGSVEAFCRLHDLAADAIRRVLPDARVGGPHTCGPTSPRAADFLRRFLAHCASGRNHATGEIGSRLDFIAFHAKGKPELFDGRVRMGIARQLQDIEQGLGIVASFDAWRETPVILGESDPEGCAACSTAMRPENAYRDGPLYGAYVVEALARTMELSAKTGVEIEGSVTWAFEFEGEPFFAGLRELATNGIDKAVLNAFRMMAMLKGERLTARSSGALPLAEVVANGVRGAPDVNAIATRDGSEVAILVWNYHDDDVLGARRVDCVDGARSRRRALRGRTVPDGRRARQRLRHVARNGLAALSHRGAIRAARGVEPTAVQRAADAARCGSRRRGAGVRLAAARRDAVPIAKGGVKRNTFSRKHHGAKESPARSAGAPRLR